MPALNGAITLGNDYTRAITTIKNTTGTLFPAVNYTLSNILVSSGGIVTFAENASVCKTGATCLVTYTYDDHTTSQGTVITNSITALSEIPNNWLLLICVVVAASVIIGIVISNLDRKLGRE